MIRWALAFGLGLALAGCARHVVVEPERVPSMNSTDWKVESTPRAASSESPATPEPSRP